MYRMTAKSDYANGAIAWPEGMGAFWPRGQERIVDQALYDRVLRDGVAEFDVKYYQPAPVEVIDLTDGVQPEEASAAGKALAQYAEETAQPTSTEPAAAPNKRAAALEKARAAKAAKAAAKADKE